MKLLNMIVPDVIILPLSIFCVLFIFLFRAVSPAHGWRDGLLAGYIALSFIAVSKYMFAQDGVVHSVKRVMCVLALTWQAIRLLVLYQDYIGTSLPMVAVGSCLAIYYTITSIIVPILSKMTMLWPWILHRQGTLSMNIVNIALPSNLLHSVYLLHLYPS
ncbi:hypothetical protein Hanom_Chr01g00055241 [Helianthus anomalus]